MQGEGKRANSLVLGYIKQPPSFTVRILLKASKNAVKFIPYSYQYVRQRCASIAAQYLDVTEIHICNTLVSYKTVLLSDIKLQRVGEWLLPMPRTTHPHDLTSYLNPQQPRRKSPKFYTREI